MAFARFTGASAETAVQGHVCQLQKPCGSELSQTLEVVVVQQAFPKATDTAVPQKQMEAGRHAGQRSLQRQDGLWDAKWNTAHHTRHCIPTQQAYRAGRRGSAGRRQMPSRAKQRDREEAERARKN